MVSFTDALNYVAYKNPVSQYTIAGLTQLAKSSVSVHLRDVFSDEMFHNNSEYHLSISLFIGFQWETIAGTINCHESGV